MVVSLSSTELELVCQEIAHAISHQRVQRIVQHGDTLFLGFGKQWLLLCVGAKQTRVHLCDKPIGSGASPSAFCMLLRKHLIGAPMRVIRAGNGCDLFFGASGARLVLRARSLELFVGERRLSGIGLGKPVDSASPTRSASPRVSVPVPLSVHPERSAAKSKGEARVFPSTSSGRAGGERLRDRNRFGDEPNISSRIAQFYAEACLGDNERARQKIARARLQRLERLVQKVASDLHRCDGAITFRKWGDLLFAHLHELPARAEKVTVSDDFESGAATDIVLDPRFTVLQNAVKMHRQAKRLLQARDRIAQRLDEVTSERDRVEADLHSGAGSATTTASIPVIDRANKKPSKTLPYREYFSQNGQAIWVGRGAKSNDTLTFQFADGDDCWLHTRDVPGAHVVVPLHRRTLSEEVLLDAATLAAHHSSARDERLVDIAYTERKYLRKVSGAPGKVTMSAQKTLRLRIEPERLRRLLETARIG